MSNDHESRARRSFDVAALGLIGDGVTPIELLARLAGQRAALTEEDAAEALVGLGYPRQTAEKAIDKARQAGETTLEGLVRAALRSLAPKR